MIFRQIKLIADNDYKKEDEHSEFKVDLFNTRPQI